LSRRTRSIRSVCYLVLNDGTNAVRPEEAEAAARLRAGAGDPYQPRSREEIAGFFAGLELLEPGVVPTSRWRPDPGDGLPGEVDALCGVGRKPGH
jgi:hypothetical protein